MESLFLTEESIQIPHSLRPLNHNLIPLRTLLQTRLTRPSEPDIHIRLFKLTNRHRFTEQMHIERQRTKCIPVHLKLHILQHFKQLDEYKPSDHRSSSGQCWNDLTRYQFSFELSTSLDALIPAPQ